MTLLLQPCRRARALVVVHIPRGLVSGTSWRTRALPCQSAAKGTRVVGTSIPTAGGSRSERSQDEGRCVGRTSGSDPRESGRTAFPSAASSNHVRARRTVMVMCRAYTKKRELTVVQVSADVSGGGTSVRNELNSRCKEDSGFFRAVDCPCQPEDGGAVVVVHGRQRIWACDG